MQYARRVDAHEREEKGAARSCFQLLFSVEEIRFHQRAESQTPTASPSISPDADTVVSSPNFVEDEDIAQLDMQELLTRQGAEQCTKDLFTAQTEVWRLTKRIKTMQDAQTGRTLTSATTSSITMETCD